MGIIGVLGKSKSLYQKWGLEIHSYNIPRNLWSIMTRLEMFKRFCPLNVSDAISIPVKLFDLFVLKSSFGLYASY